MRTVVGWMLIVGGCSGDTDDPNNDATETGTTPLSTAETATDTGGTTTVDRSGFLDGTVVNSGGTGQNTAILRLCRGPACRNGETDASGSYVFDDVHVDWHSFEIKPPNGTSGLATAFAPLVFATDESRTVPVVLPTLDAATPLSASPTEIEAGAGLFLTLDDSTLEAPLFADEATEVAGVLVDAADRMPVDLPGTVIAMWYLEPFDHHAAAGIPVRVANNWKLADASTYQVYVGSYETSVWIDAGSLTVNGAWLEGTANLPITSTVILVDES